MGNSKIILASASPRRREILSSHKIEFDVVPSKATELSDKFAEPKSLCIANAVAKASDVAMSNDGATVLGADTIVVLDGRIYGKPRDLEEAFDMLRKLSGRTHIVYTGVALARLTDGKLSLVKDVGRTEVEFKKLDGDGIRKYLYNVYVLDKAGAYAAQECGSMIIEKIVGDFDNVMGLPFGIVKKLLDTFKE